MFTLEDLRKLLQAKYQNFTIRRLTSSERYSIKDCYINLSIIKEDAAYERQALESQEEEEEEEAARNQRLSSFEAIHAPRQHFAIEQFFVRQQNDTQDPSRILVVGRAGIGKTTLCKYVAARNTQAEDSLWADKVVILIPLRALLDERNLSLAHVVREYCLPGDDRPSEEALKTFFRLHGNQCVWVLDGYDEVAQQVQPRPGRRETPRNREWKRLFESIFTKGHVIITSRPSVALPFRFDRKLENIGFTDENIKSYIKTFITPAARAARLEKLLRSNAGLWGIAHIPINLDLLCDSDHRLLHGDMTLTSLYTHLTTSLIRRYEQRQAILYGQPIPESREETEGEEEEEEEEEEEIEAPPARRRREPEHIRTPVVRSALSFLAYKTIREEHILIAPELYRRRMRASKASQTELLATGLLKRTTDGAVYFLHLTFHEYFAANFMAQQIIQNGPEQLKVLEFIQLEKYNRRYEIVHWFTAGLLYQHWKETRDELPLLKFFDAIQDAPRDLVGIAHAALLIRCLEECEADQTLPIYNHLMQFVEPYLDWGMKFSGWGTNLGSETLKNTFILCPQVISQLALKQLNNSTDPQEKFQAIWLNLSQLKITPSHALCDFIIQKIRTCDPVIHCMLACGVLGSLNHEYTEWPFSFFPITKKRKLAEELIAILQNPTHKKFHKGSVEHLKKLLNSDTPNMPYVKILEALITINQHDYQYLEINKMPVFARKQCTAMLLTKLEYGSAISIKIAALTVLGRFPKSVSSDHWPRTQKILLRLMVDDNAELRAKALEILATLFTKLPLSKCQVFLKPLEQNLEHNDKAVQKAVATAFGNFPGPLTRNTVQKCVAKSIKLMSAETRLSILDNHQKLIGTILKLPDDQCMQAIHQLLNKTNSTMSNYYMTSELSGAIRQLAERIDQNKLLRLANMLLQAKYFSGRYSLPLSDVIQRMSQPQLRTLLKTLQSNSQKKQQYLLNAIAGCYGEYSKECKIKEPYRRVIVQAILAMRQYNNNALSSVLTILIYFPKKIADPPLQKRVNEGIIRWLKNTRGTIRIGLADIWINLLRQLPKQMPQEQLLAVSLALLPKMNAITYSTGWEDDILCIIPDMVRKMTMSQKTVIASQLTHKRNDSHCCRFTKSLALADIADCVRFSEAKLSDTLEILLICLGGIYDGQEESCAPEGYGPQVISRMMQIFTANRFVGLQPKILQNLRNGTVWTSNAITRLQQHIPEKMLISIIKELRKLLSSSHQAYACKLITALVERIPAAELNQIIKNLDQLAQDGNSDATHTLAALSNKIPPRQFNRISNQLLPLLVHTDDKKRKSATTILSAFAQYMSKDKKRQYRIQFLKIINSRPKEIAEETYQIMHHFMPETIPNSEILPILKVLCTAARKKKIYIRSGPRMFGPRDQIIQNLPVHNLSETQQISCTEEILKAIHVIGPIPYFFTLLERLPLRIRMGDSLALSGVKRALKRLKCPTVVCEANDGAANLGLPRLVRRPRLTALHNAAQRGKVQLIRNMPTPLQDINDQNNTDRVTPIMLAIKHGKIRTTTLLLSRGADLNCFNTHAETPIIQLMRKIELKLHHGATSTSQENWIALLENMIRQRRPSPTRLQHALSECFNYHTLSTAERAKLVSKVVGQLLGIYSLHDYYCSETTRQSYRLHVQNFLRIQTEHAGELQSDGNDFACFIGLRIRFYFERLLQLKKGLQIELPHDVTKTQLIQKLEMEILTDIEILWNETIRKEISAFPNASIKRRLQTAHANNILEQIRELPEKQEYACQSGYYGTLPHCLYVSFVKQRRNRVLIRIDNRWVQANRRDGRLHGQPPSVTNDNPRKIRPYWCGTVAIDHPSLLNYIQSIMRALSTEHAVTAIELIYPEQPIGARSSQDLWADHIDDWPSQNIQTTQSDNCTMSSHNFGVCARVGEAIYCYLINFEKSQIWQEPEQTRTTRTTNNQNSQQDDAPSSSPPLTSAPLSQSHVSLFPSLPSHIQLMHYAAEQLSVGYQEIYSGITLESTIVAIAGIQHAQPGARFRRNINNDRTKFWLQLTENEKNTFLTYYRRNFPNLIQQTGTEGNHITVEMDTQILHNRVMPALGRYRTTSTPRSTSRPIRNSSFF